MFGRRRKASKKVAVGQLLAPDGKKINTRKLHAVLDITEDLLTIATASVILALVLELGIVSGQAQPVTPTRDVAARPDLGRLLTSAYTGSTPAPRANADSDSKSAIEWPSRQGCSSGTVMNVVAHEDDDLLFINPDLINTIQRHDCIRTIYVTAGDDGRGTGYLLSREAGSEAAYDVMLGNAKPWKYQKLTIASGATVVTASPTGNTDISLIFLRLPDGNLDGSGFPDTGNESIAKLESGLITSIASVDGQTKYTSARLTATLEALMELYMPTSINTQADDAGLPITDHSDHVAVSEYTTLAASMYARKLHITSLSLVHYFIGYPIRGMISNLSLADTARKAAAFFAYAVHDPGVCTSMGQCVATDSSYGLYLSRQYIVGQ